MRLFTRKEKVRWLTHVAKRMSSSAVMLEYEGKLLIVKANYKPYWTLPGGIIDEGETPRQAAIREVFEEIGIHLDESRLEFVLVADRISKHLQSYQFIFKAPLSKAMLEKVVLQQSEIDDYALVTKAEVALKSRPYAKAIEHWAANALGYTEQEFNDLG